MRTVVNAIVLSLGLTAFGTAGAIKPRFTAPALTPAQMKSAKTQIKNMLGKQNVGKISFGFNAPIGMIGGGFHVADVTLKQGKDIKFTVIADNQGKVTVEKE
jgi:hypothetical protein